MKEIVIPKIGLQHYKTIIFRVCCDYFLTYRCKNGIVRVHFRNTPKNFT